MLVPVLIYFLEICDHKILKDISFEPVNGQFLRLPDLQQVRQQPGIVEIQLGGFYQAFIEVIMIRV